MEGGAHGPGGLTEDGDPSWITPEPRDVLLHPAQRRLLIEETDVGGVGPPVRRDRCEVEEPEGTQPVVDGDHDDTALGQVCARVPRGRPGRLR